MGRKFLQDSKENVALISLKMTITKGYNPELLLESGINEILYKMSRFGRINEVARLF